MSADRDAFIAPRKERWDRLERLIDGAPGAADVARLAAA